MRHLASLGAALLASVLLAGCGASPASTGSGAGTGGGGPSARSSASGSGGGSGGYAGGYGYGAPASSPTATPPSSATTGRSGSSSTGSTGTSGSGTLGLADTSLGTVLVGPDGHTLYSYEPDKQGASTCYAQCAALWHPLTGSFTPGNGIDASKVGSVQRRDGSTQVTYDGWPLYAYTQDSAPGDVNGQGVNGVWWVLDRNGQQVH